MWRVVREWWFECVAVVAVLLIGEWLWGVALIVTAATLRLIDRYRGERG